MLREADKCMHVCPSLSLCVCVCVRARTRLRRRGELEVNWPLAR